MITVDTKTLTSASITDLVSEDLFVYSGTEGNCVGVVIENDRNAHSIIWMWLTGKDMFSLDQAGQRGLYHYSNAPKVVRLSIGWKKLQVQIDETQIARTTKFPSSGTLLIGDEARIVARFVPDGEEPDRTVYAIRLHDVSLGASEDQGYVCDRWRLIYVPQGLPPEEIARFPAKQATE